jgi:hypothetical protein
MHILKKLVNIFQPFFLPVCISGAYFLGVGLADGNCSLIAVTVSSMATVSFFPKSVILDVLLRHQRSNSASV